MTAHAALTVDAAVARLRDGGLVAVPTETVYGLAADARNPLAVRRIFAAKGRPVDHPVIVHLAAPRDPAEPVAALAGWVAPGAAEDPRLAAVARAFWPGPLTVIVPRHGDVLDEVTGGLPTVGLRIPDHPLTQALLAAFGDGLAAPSANRFGRVSPTTAAHVRAELGADLPVLDGGPCAVGVESTILDLSGPIARVLRPGGVTEDALAACIGEVSGPPGPDDRPATRAPGTLAAHYAPHTALRVVDDVAAEVRRLEARGLTVAVLQAGPPADHARRLYAELRRLDAMGVDVLVAERAVDQGLGRAVNDRLARAARGAGGAPHD